MGLKCFWRQFLLFGCVLWVRKRGRAAACKRCNPGSPPTPVERTLSACFSSSDEKTAAAALKLCNCDFKSLPHSFIHLCCCTRQRIFDISPAAGFFITRALKRRRLPTLFLSWRANGNFSAYSSPLASRRTHGGLFACWSGGIINAHGIRSLHVCLVPPSF